MNLTDIKDLYRNSDNYIDKEVTVGGWVRSIRDSKTFGFIVVNDGTFFEPLQIVYSDSLENFETISKLNVGSAIVAKGKIVATPQAKQAFENLSNLLAAAGTSMDKVVKTTVFIKEMNDFGAINEVYAEFFPAPFPSRSCVEVARLPKDVMLEIEAIATK